MFYFTIRILYAVMSQPWFRQDMALLMAESHVYLLDIKSSPTLIGQNKNRTYVLHQVEFVNKNNPRGDTSISAGWPSVRQLDV